MIRQCDLFDFASGPRPHRDEVDDEDEVAPLAEYRGRRCARCGKPLRGGGLKVMGWPGLVCWDCFHKPMGRRDGRRDLSSDASGSRNSGYNLRR